MAANSLKALRKLAEGNGTQLPEGMKLCTTSQLEPRLNRALATNHDVDIGSEGHIPLVRGREQTKSNVDLFVIPTLRNRLVIMMFCWFTAEMVYYALG